MLTAETVALKLALVEPAGTVRATGTLTAVSLLATLTLSPPVGEAVLNVTVQASVPEPVMEPLAQVIPLNEDVVLTPLPLRLTTEVPPVDELLDTVSCPVAAPGTVGSNCTVTAAL